MQYENNQKIVGLKWNVFYIFHRIPNFDTCNIEKSDDVPLKSYRLIHSGTNENKNRKAIWSA
jgi:hypothetical protein